MAATPTPSTGLTEVAFITSTSANSPTPWQAFDGSNIVFYDINHTGKPEIIASNDNLRHYVIDPRTGKVLAELHGFHPGGDGWAGRELDGPAVGDVFGNNGTEIAIDDGASYISLWQFEGNQSNATHMAFTKLWEKFIDTQAWDPNFDSTHPWNTNDTPASESHPFLADIDGKGWDTIFAQADNVAANVAYYPNGTLRWFQDPPVDSNAGSIVADLNGDGHLEAIYASDGGPIYVRDPYTGALLWQYDVRCQGGVAMGNGSNCDWTDPGSVTLSPVVADLLGDGKKEICEGTRDAYNQSDPRWNDPTQIQTLVDASHARIFCFTHDGHLLWEDQLPWFNPHIAMNAVPFAVDTTDGGRDLIWEDWNTIGHKPGNWQTTTRGPNLFALDGRTGAVLWHDTLINGWSNHDVSLADVYGNGKQEIVADEFGPTGGDGISIIDPHTGQKLAWYPLEAGWVANRGPLVADLYGDGRMEVIIPMVRGESPSYCPQQRSDLGCRQGAIEILATGQPMASLFTDSFTWNLALDHNWDGKGVFEQPTNATPTPTPSPTANSTVQSPKNATPAPAASPGPRAVPALPWQAAVAGAAGSALVIAARRRPRR
ncbi:MAG: hypothetical protein ACYDDF_10335 [Thermoplasmatota archaeon]